VTFFLQKETLRFLGFRSGMAEVTVLMGCEPVLMFNWIHTLLGNAAYSLSRADSVYFTGPIHPSVHYVTWKMRDPITQRRYIIQDERNALCKFVLGKLQLFVLWLFRNYKTQN